ncbi:hypothetical protein THRCLA_06438 [Thraustotheca clavata]|uniref:Tyrosine phosphatase n=1 Tax=Thraustotheca clavata TaxID=74557 RepID=A0A1V9ZPB5_9STRA|nr:hypothetical protein THRCLA_06438 [Thraustotheca clavata]
MMAAIIPPFRFTTVENGLHRGAYPTLPNFRFLRRLKLKTLISLIPEEPTSDLADFCVHEGIVKHTFRIEKYSSDSVTVSPNTVSTILQLLLNKDNFPIYIHCLDGANVVGIVIMVLRKLQNWSKLATLQEFCRFTRDHCIEKDESEYLSTFSAEITLPPYSLIPRWLWNGVRIQKHPTMLINTQYISQNPSQSFLPVLEGELNSDIAIVPSPFGERNPSENTLSAGVMDSTEKSDGLLRSFEEGVADSPDDMEVLLDDPSLPVPVPRSLLALDLAGI